MSFRGAIFDLDGVIVDTVPLHFKAWKKMFAEYGKEFSMREYEAHVDGVSRMQGARAILPDIPEDELTRAALRKEQYYMEFVRKEGVFVFESTVALIRQLRERGIARAVISSSKNCPDILNIIGLYDLIDAEVNGKELVKSKPDPWIFLEAVKRLGLTPEQCIAFEDAALGVESATRAGLVTIGIDRRRNPSRLAKADRVINDVAHIRIEELNAFFGKE